MPHPRAPVKAARSSCASILLPTGRVGLALATTVLLVAAFPAPDRGELAWIALAPLALACRDLPPWDPTELYVDPSARMGHGTISSLVCRLLGSVEWPSQRRGRRPSSAHTALAYVRLFWSAWNWSPVDAPSIAM